MLYLNMDNHEEGLVEGKTVMSCDGSTLIYYSI